MSERHIRMKNRIKELFSEFDNNQIIYACNLISRELRKLNQDIYDVVLQKQLFDDKEGYFSYFDVTINNRTIHVRVRVD